MPRLIDAEALERRMNERHRTMEAKNGSYDHYVCGYLDAIDDVEDAPTIDAEPVRHGRWIRMDDTFARWKCSECGAIESHSGWEHCHCGAKMDGGADNA